MGECLALDAAAKQASCHVVLRADSGIGQAKSRWRHQVLTQPRASQPVHLHVYNMQAGGEETRAGEVCVTQRSKFKRPRLAKAHIAAPRM